VETFQRLNPILEVGAIDWPEKKRRRGQKDFLRWKTGKGAPLNEKKWSLVKDKKRFHETKQKKWNRDTGQRKSLYKIKFSKALQ